MKRFDGRVCVVTGGGQGLGAAIARRLAAEGGVVVVADRNPDAGAALLADAPTALEFVVADVTDTEQVTALVDRVHRNHERIDVLVNNAGIVRDNRVENISDEDWHAVVDVSLTAAFKCARAVLPIMKAQEFGRIVSFASMSWHGNFGQANYVAAKAGVVGLARALALEGARHGVTSNVISPGLFGTPMLASMNAAARDLLVSKIPMRQLGDPADIAEAVAFLSSPAASYITGVVLDVDGGISIGSSVR